MKIDYPNNFLEKVIIRIDFANPIKELRDDINPKINSTIIKAFPIYEPTDAVEKKLKFEISKNSSKIHEEMREEFKEFIFFGKNREKELHININSLLIIYYKYSSFNILKDDFLSISKSLFTTYELFNIKRFGLRYINKIKLNEKNPTNWTKYLNANLLKTLKIYSNQLSISRAFHVLELNMDEIRMKFQFGMYNTDYPATIHKKEFILDYDAYYPNLIQNYSELEKYLEQCRNEIKNLFEACIKDDLRRKMSE